MGVFKREWIHPRDGCIRTQGEQTPRIGVLYFFAADCDIVQDFGPVVSSNCAVPWVQIQ
jgi:hypothetical protein